MSNYWNLIERMEFWFNFKQNYICIFPGAVDQAYTIGLNIDQSRNR